MPFHKLFLFLGKVDAGTKFAPFPLRDQVFLSASAVTIWSGDSSPQQVSGSRILCPIAIFVHVQLKRELINCHPYIAHLSIMWHMPRFGKKHLNIFSYVLPTGVIYCVSIVCGG